MNDQPDIRAQLLHYATTATNTKDIEDINMFWKTCRAAIQDLGIRQDDVPSDEFVAQWDTLEEGGEVPDPHPAVVVIQCMRTMCRAGLDRSAFPRGDVRGTRVTWCMARVAGWVVALLRIPPDDISMGEMLRRALNTAIMAKTPAAAASFWEVAASAVRVIKPVLNLEPDNAARTDENHLGRALLRYSATMARWCPFEMDSDNATYCRRGLEKWARAFPEDIVW